MAKEPNQPAVPGSSPEICSASARREITQAIIFYDGRGWDWLPLVAYLSAKAYGMGPPWVVRTKIGVGLGRPRTETPNDPKLTDADGHGAGSEKESEQ